MRVKIINAVAALLFFLGIINYSLGEENVKPGDSPVCWNPEMVIETLAEPLAKGHSKGDIITAWFSVCERGDLAVSLFQTFELRDSEELYNIVFMMNVTLVNAARTFEKGNQR